MKWFARGGSHMNYYMWVGGNQFGRWTGDAITTMYAVDAMVCPDGLPHEPKFSQMAAMHSAIAKVAHVIAGDKAQLDHAKDLGGNAVAYIYGGESAGVAFIECLDGCAGGRPRVVKLNGHTFKLPIARSSSLVDLKTGEVLFNTVTDHRVPGLEHRGLAAVASPFEKAGWKQWREPVLAKDVPHGTYPSNCSFTQTSPLEQTVFTMCLPPDHADAGARSKRSTYALYETTVAGSHPSKLSVGTNQATTLFAFVDGVLTGHAQDLSHSRGSSVALDLDLGAGYEDESTARTVTIISEEMGYANYGFKSQLRKGISGKVLLDGVDITSNAPHGWHMRGGLAGEHLAVFTAAGAEKVTWTPVTSDATGATWYKTAFDTPASVASGDAKLLVNATGLNRGRLWVNGHDAGRYYLDPRNKPVGCIDSASGAKCSYNTSSPYSGSQCYGLQALRAGDASAGACADACCAQNEPTWQWSAKKDPKNGADPGCWCGKCSSDFMPDPTWVGGHDTGSPSTCATQTLYYVPKAWLSASGNSLVLFEGGGLGAPGNINAVGLTVATMHSTDREAIDFQNLHSCAF